MSKGFTFLALLLSVMMGFSQGLSLPVDFESTTQTYTFTNFDGGNATVLANPDMTGLNTSANAAQMIKGPGGQVWGGSFLDMGAPIDF